MLATSFLFVSANHSGWFKISFKFDFLKTRFFHPGLINFKTSLDIGGIPANIFQT